MCQTRAVYGIEHKGQRDSRRKKTSDLSRAYSDRKRKEDFAITIINQKLSQIFDLRVRITNVILR